MKTKKNQPRITAGIGANALLPTGSTISIAELIDSVKDEFSDIWSNDVITALGIQRRTTEITQHLQFSERRHRTLTIRQAVSRMKVNERMNETEKLLLGRYKADAVRNVYSLFTIKLSLTIDFL